MHNFLNCFAFGFVATVLILHFGIFQYGMGVTAYLLDPLLPEGVDEGILDLALIGTYLITFIALSAAALLAIILIIGKRMPFWMIAASAYAGMLMAAIVMGLSRG